MRQKNRFLLIFLCWACADIGLCALAGAAASSNPNDQIVSRLIFNWDQRGQVNVFRGVLRNKQWITSLSSTRQVFTLSDRNTNQPISQTEILRTATGRQVKVFWGKDQVSLAKNSGTSTLLANMNGKIWSGLLNHQGLWGYAYNPQGILQSSLDVYYKNAYENIFLKTSNVYLSGAFSPAQGSVLFKDAVSKRTNLSANYTEEGRKGVVFVNNKGSNWQANWDKNIYSLLGTDLTGATKALLGLSHAGDKRDIWAQVNDYAFTETMTKGALSGQLYNDRKKKIDGKFSYRQQGQTRSVHADINKDQIFLTRMGNSLSGQWINSRQYLSGYFEPRRFSTGLYDLSTNHAITVAGWDNTQQQHYAGVQSRDDYFWGFGNDGSYQAGLYNLKKNKSSAHVNYTQQGKTNTLNGYFQHSQFDFIRNGDSLNGQVIDSRNSMVQGALSVSKLNTTTFVNGHWMQNYVFGYLDPSTSFVRLYDSPTGRTLLAGGMNRLPNDARFIWAQNKNYYISGSALKGAFSGNLYDSKLNKTRGQINYTQQGRVNSLNGYFDQHLFSFMGDGDHFSGQLADSGSLTTQASFQYNHVGGAYAFDLRTSHWLLNLYGDHTNVYGGWQDPSHRVVDSVWINPHAGDGNAQVTTAKNSISFSKAGDTVKGNILSRDGQQTKLSVNGTLTSNHGHLDILGEKYKTYLIYGNNAFDMDVNGAGARLIAHADGSAHGSDKALHVFVDHKTFDFTQQRVVNGVKGQVNLDAGNFLGVISYTRLNGLLSAQGQIDGTAFNYREIQPKNGISRELMITKKNGQNIFLDNTDFEALIHGHINHILDIVEYDFQTNLDFNLHWGGKNFVAFDTHQRLLSASVEGNSAALKLGKTGYLQFDAANNNLHLRISSPAKETLFLERANFRNDFFALNLDNTTLNYNDTSRVAGLYTSGSYLVKVQTGGLHQMSSDFKDTFKLVKSGDFDKQRRDQLIRDNIKEIDINFREVAKGHHIHFSDQRWNSLMTSLAWDVPSASFTSDDIIKVIDAKDSKGQTYTALSRLLKQNPSQALTAKEKALSYQMGASITPPASFNNSLAPNNAQMPSMKTLGITGLNSSATVNFDQSNPPLLGGEGRVSLGADQGDIDVNVPLAGQYSRTMLGLTTYAQRYYASIGDEIISDNNMSLGINSLFYVYRFPQPLTLSVRDSYRQGFSLNHFNGSSFDFDLDSTNQMFGTAIPGMMLGADLKSSEDGWYTSAKLMPYVPLNLDESLKVHPGGLDYASDLHAGVKGKLFDQGVQLDMGKDVNDYLTLAPTMTFKDTLSLGVETASPGMAYPQMVKYKTGLKTGPVDTHVFWEQNSLNQTDSIGTSIDTRLGEKAYNVSFGVSRWDNDGQRQIVERYLSLGMDLNAKTRLIGAVTVNDIDQTINYTTSSQFNLDKNGDKKFALETSILQGATDTGYDVRLKGQFLF